MGSDFGHYCDVGVYFRQIRKVRHNICTVQWLSAQSIVEAIMLARSLWLHVKLSRVLHSVAPYPLLQAMPLEGYSHDPRLALSPSTRLSSQ